MKVQTFFRRNAGVWLVLPSFLLILVFVYGFIAYTGWTSLTDLNQLQMEPGKFIGTINYSELLQNPRFQIDIRNTVIFSLIFIPGCLIIGLGSALLIQSGIKSEGIFRTIYLAPMAISFIVTGVVWRWLMNPSAGLNDLFAAIGLGFLQNAWYTSPTLGIAAIALPAIWQLSGYTMALYLAGLRAIPKDLYEAAAVDGAGGFYAFRRITFPLLVPVTLSAIIILGHISLKVFDLVVAIAGMGGGPGFSADVPATFMFQTTFQANRFAEGSAISILLLLVVSLLVIPYLYFSLRQEGQR